MQLSSSQIKTLEIVDTNIKTMFSKDYTGHDYDHIRRVVNLTTRLLVDKANPFVTYMIAYFHDVFDEKVEINEFKDLQSIVELWNLDLEGFDKEIEAGIQSIGFKGGFIEHDKSLEAIIVSDADYLDSMGAIGIARTFYYAGSKGLPFHNKDLEGVYAKDYEDYRKLDRNTITHFEEKLLRLKDYVATEKGKVIAHERHGLLLEFYHQFLKEVQ